MNEHYMHHLASAVVLRIGTNSAGNKQKLYSIIALKPEATSMLLSCRWRQLSVTFDQGTAHYHGGIHHVLLGRSVL